ncbi:indole-3-glycerol phosphate synthase [Natronosalvus rutilus]|uniref:Indole-3-glycerol phosphate synthase n=1 Tax=Natronosalvus rutilus TaxID=2953753 RepID=A0A9E7NB30_9EURY|nr:indole-3-glycerol phosphate synthase [Natronosalvus rutilus]UTF53658.1 indole-3-glycerol-phosphate synthase [Natronosalvus rutilus]
METTGDLAASVRSILESAGERGGADAVLDVDPRSVERALERAEADGRVPIIAEVKPTSPTSDGVRNDDPATLAQEMVAGGATAISVLTEPTHFGGSADALRDVRAAVDVPVLRKDFVLEEAHLDLVEADLVLLIARFVDDLAGLLAAARDRGFQVLVEVHDRAELETALEAGAEVIGVNNRDLARLEVDLETFESVAPHVPDDVTLIAESGISTPADVRRMREAGADALLVGSAIMDHAGETDGDVRANTRRLTTAETDTT